MPGCPEPPWVLSDRVKINTQKSSLRSVFCQNRSILILFFSTCGSLNALIQIWNKDIIKTRGSEPRLRYIPSHVVSWKRIVSLSFKDENSVGSTADGASYRAMHKCFHDNFANTRLFFLQDGRLDTPQVTQSLLFASTSRVNLSLGEVTFSTLVYMMFSE